MNLIPLLFSLLLLSCSHPTSQKPRVDKNPNIESIAIFAMNDFHGQLASVKHKIPSRSGTPFDFETGGAEILASYLGIVKDEWKDRMLIVNAGDEWQGSLESNLYGGSPVVQFFNLLGFHADAIGNHEFDFGKKVLHSRMSEAKYAYLSANLKADLPNFFPSKLYQVGKLKVGVIGLTTPETPKISLPDNVKGFIFSEMKEPALREAKHLRAAGADIVIITAHAGTECKDLSISEKVSDNRVRTASTPQGACSSEGEISKLASELPEGTIDVIVSGHTHQIIHHWLGGIPTVQAAAYNRYFNLVYLKYDLIQKKLLRDETEIEGPVPVCSSVFSKTQNCELKGKMREELGDVIPATFHEKPVVADARVVALLKPVTDRVSKIKNEIVGSCESEMKNGRERETEMGNLITDALRSETKADFAVYNAGGIRISIDAGPITFEEVFKAFPFDNFVSQIKVTGAQLKLLIEVLMSGEHGISPISGLRVTLKAATEKGEPRDLNGDGMFEKWEENRVVSIETLKGKPLEEKKIYKVALNDFMLAGGDHLLYPMSLIVPKNKRTNARLQCRDALIHYLKKKKVVNTLAEPLFDKKNPRVRFDKSIK